MYSTEAFVQISPPRCAGLVHANQFKKLVINCFTSSDMTDVVQGTRIRYAVHLLP
jgi:hypothetical protein